MKPTIMLLTVSFLGLGIWACGSTNKEPGSTPTKSSHRAVVADAVDTSPALRNLRGDEDDDETGENVGNTNNDNDEDFDNDYKQESEGYYDSDDGKIRAYGHAAGADERKTLAAVVERYYAAAAAGDGARACSQVDANFTRAIPEDYGQSPGPAYLRGRTCATVLGRLFKHLRKELAGGVVVTNVRVKGDRALVLVGSRSTPAGFVTLERKHARWGIVGLLAAQLP